MRVFPRLAPTSFDGGTSGVRRWLGHYWRGDLSGTIGMAFMPDVLASWGAGNDAHPFGPEFPTARPSPGEAERRDNSATSSNLAALAFICLDRYGPNGSRSRFRERSLVPRGRISGSGS